MSSCESQIKKTRFSIDNQTANGDKTFEDVTPNSNSKVDLSSPMIAIVNHTSLENATESTIINNQKSFDESKQDDDTLIKVRAANQSPQKKSKKETFKPKVTNMNFNFADKSSKVSPKNIGCLSNKLIQQANKSGRNNNFLSREPSTQRKFIIDNVNNSSSDILNFALNNQMALNRASVNKTTIATDKNPVGASLASAITTINGSHVFDGSRNQNKMPHIQNYSQKQSPKSKMGLKYKAQYSSRRMPVAHSQNLKQKQQEQRYKVNHSALRNSYNYKNSNITNHQQMNSYQFQQILEGQQMQSGIFNMGQTNSNFQKQPNISSLQIMDSDADTDHNSKFYNTQKNVISPKKNWQNMTLRQSQNIKDKLKHMGSKLNTVGKQESSMWKNKTNYGMVNGKPIDGVISPGGNPSFTGDGDIVIYNEDEQTKLPQIKSRMSRQDEKTNDDTFYQLRSGSINDSQIEKKPIKNTTRTTFGISQSPFSKYDSAAKRSPVNRKSDTKAQFGFGLITCLNRDSSLQIENNSHNSGEYKTDNEDQLNSNYTVAGGRDTYPVLSQLVNSNDSRQVVSDYSPCQKSNIERYVPKSINYKQVPDHLTYSQEKQLKARKQLRAKDSGLPEHLVKIKEQSRINARQDDGTQIISSYEHVSEYNKLRKKLEQENDYNQKKGTQAMLMGGLLPGIGPQYEEKMKVKTSNSISSLQGLQNLVSDECAADGSPISNSPKVVALAQTSETPGTDNRNFGEAIESLARERGNVINQLTSQKTQHDIEITEGSSSTNVNPLKNPAVTRNILQPSSSFKAMQNRHMRDVEADLKEKQKAEMKAKRQKDSNASSQPKIVMIDSSNGLGNRRDNRLTNKPDPEVKEMTMEQKRNFIQQQVLNNSEEYQAILNFAENQHRMVQNEHVERIEKARENKVQKEISSLLKVESIALAESQLKINELKGISSKPSTPKKTKRIPGVTNTPYSLAQVPIDKMNKAKQIGDEESMAQEAFDLINMRWGYIKKKDQLQNKINYMINDLMEEKTISESLKFIGRRLNYINKNEEIPQRVLSMISEIVARKKKTIMAQQGSPNMKRAKLMEMKSNFNKIVKLNDDLQDGDISKITPEKMDIIKKNIKLLQSPEFANELKELVEHLERLGDICFQVKKQEKIEAYTDSRIQTPEKSLDKKDSETHSIKSDKSSPKLLERTAAPFMTELIEIEKVPTTQMNRTTINMNISESGNIGENKKTPIRDPIKKRVLIAQNSLNISSSSNKKANITQGIQRMKQEALERLQKAKLQQIALLDRRVQADMRRSPIQREHHNKLRNLSKSLNNIDLSDHYKMHDQRKKDAAGQRYKLDKSRPKKKDEILIVNNNSAQEYTSDSKSKRSVSYSPNVSEKKSQFKDALIQRNVLFTVDSVGSMVEASGLGSLNASVNQELMSQSNSQGSLDSCQSNLMNWIHLDLLRGSDAVKSLETGNIDEQFQAVKDAINSKFDLFGHVEQKTQSNPYLKKQKPQSLQQQDITNFMDEKSKELYNSPDIDLETKALIMQKAEEMRQTKIALKEKDAQEKKLAKIERGGGGMSANDVANLMNDDQLVDRYAKHLNRILLLYHDPFVKHKHQIWQDQTEPSQQMDFFQRMKKDQEARDQKEAEMVQQKQQNLLVNESLGSQGGSSQQSKQRKRVK